MFSQEKQILDKACGEVSSSNTEIIFNTCPPDPSEPFQEKKSENSPFLAITNDSIKLNRAQENNQVDPDFSDPNSHQEASNDSISQTAQRNSDQAPFQALNNGDNINQAQDYGHSVYKTENDDKTAKSSQDAIYNLFNVVCIPVMFLALSMPIVRQITPILFNLSQYEPEKDNSPLRNSKTRYVTPLEKQEKGEKKNSLDELELKQTDYNETKFVCSDSEEIILNITSTVLTFPVQVSNVGPPQVPYPFANLLDDPDSGDYLLKYLFDLNSDNHALNADDYDDFNDDQMDIFNDATSIVTTPEDESYNLSS